MDRKLPFVGRIFWKVLAIVIVLVVVGWWLVTRFSEYEMTPADYGGSTICTVLLAYLVHLWLLPVEDDGIDDEAYEDTDSSSEESEPTDEPSNI